MNYNRLHVIHELTDYYYFNRKMILINAGHIGTNAFYAEIDFGMKFSDKVNNFVYFNYDNSHVAIKLNKEINKWNGIFLEYNVGAMVCE